MTPAEVTDSIRAESAALEQIASLIYELWGRLSLINSEQLTQPEIDLRIGLVHGLWQQLDELGVDLNLPDLKTLVVAHAANHPTPDEAVAPDRDHGPASSGPKSSGTDAAQSAPAGMETSVGNPATPLPVPLDPEPDIDFEQWRSPNAPLALREEG